MTAEHRGTEGGQRLTHTNRLGQVYTLCRIESARGPRYVMAREVVGEALTSLPVGYEIAENVHGQVSVRKIRPAVFAPEELQAVRDVLAGRAETKAYRAEPQGKAIVIYHPLPAWTSDQALGLDESTVDALRHAVTAGDGKSLAALLESLQQERGPDELMRALTFLSLDRARAYVESQPPRYAEILRLRLVEKVPRIFGLDRRRFVGEEDWWWLDDGTDPAALVRTVLDDLGPTGPNDSLFERL